jgi:hypothetical protein
VVKKTCIVFVPGRKFPFLYWTDTLFFIPTGKYLFPYSAEEDRSEFLYRVVPSYFVVLTEKM